MDAVDECRLTDSSIWSWSNYSDLTRRDLGTQKVAVWKGNGTPYFREISVGGYYYFIWPEVMSTYFESSWIMIWLHAFISRLGSLFHAASDWEVHHSLLASGALHSGIKCHQNPWHITDVGVPNGSTVRPLVRKNGSSITCLIRSWNL